MTTARNFALHGAIALLTCLMLSVGLVRSAHSNEPAGATAPTPATPEAAPAGKDPSSWEEGDEDDGDRTPSDRHGHRAFRKHQGHVNNHVGIGHDSALAAGQQAEEVISIFGSSMSAGEVADSVVSVVGNTRVTGATGGSVVSVLGGTYVDAKVDGDVVAVLGGVELGPHAEIGGDVVAVGGGILRDPSAILHGDVHDIAFGSHPGLFQWLGRWVSECLVYGRLLAFAPGLAWTWGVGIIALALYVLAALLFRPAVEKCVQALDTHPGPSLLAALIALLGVPVLVALLFVTIVGILAVPVVVIGVVITAVFGKLVVLAWIGSRIAAGRGAGARSHLALWVLIGGLIMLVLYAVPVVGILIYKLGEFIGIGAVLYTLLQSVQGRRLAAAATPDYVAPAAAGAEYQASVDAAPAAAAASPASTGPAATAAAEPGVTISPAAAVSYPRAGFWLRMGALSIDVILVGAILHLVFQGGRMHLLLLASYGAVMWKLKGATVGGIVLNLHLVRLDGRPIDWSTAIVRALGCFLSLFVAGLGFIWIAIDRERQAWHDRIAGTVVVVLPKGISLV